MGLSSNIFWHQTNYRNLRKILKDKKILCSYGMEDLSFVLGQKYAFPMVSMCDLPFSEMSSYQGKYGAYSIGLRRSWGLKNKFNPVWYCNTQSNIAEALRKGFLNVNNKDNHQGDVILLLNILSYVKLVEGELKQYEYKSYRFYDEREVRFVPSFLSLIKLNYSPFLDVVAYEAFKNDNGGQSTLSYGVSFEWEDVKYLIVKEDKHVPLFRDYIKELGCPSDLIHIFSSSEVKDDFIGSNHNIETVTYHLKEKDIKGLASIMGGLVNKIIDKT